MDDPAATIERDAAVEGGGAGCGPHPVEADGPGRGGAGRPVGLDDPRPPRRAAPAGARRLGEGKGRDAAADGDDDGTVRAVRRYRNNGELIEAAARLGHLRADWLVADVTFGKGTFWRAWRPERLVPSDLYPDPEHPCDRQDATALPYRDDLFDAVVIDAPYKLNGTATESVDARYGVAEYASADDRHKLMRAMLAEGCRVTRPSTTNIDGDRIGGRILFKCQDQVNAGRLHWQTFMAFGWAAELGLALVEKLDYAGGRKQPPRERRRCLACGRGKVDRKHRCRQVREWLAGRTVAELTALRESSSTPWLELYPSPQEHAYYRPSSLLIFRKDPR